MILRSFSLVHIWVNSTDDRVYVGSNIYYFTGIFFNHVTRNAYKIMNF